MKKISNKSFVLILLVSFWSGYTILSFIQSFLLTMASKEKFEIERNKKIDFLLETTKIYMASDNHQLAMEQLKIATKLDFIGFYCIKKNEQIISEFYPNEKISGCEYVDKIEYKNLDRFYRVHDRILKPVKIDDYFLIVGYGSSNLTYLYWSHRENLVPFIKDIVIITLFVGVLIYLILKDFVTIDQLLKSGNKEKLSKLRANSKEAQTLIDSATTLDNINSQNRQSIHLLQHTVGEALASEIRNKTPSLTSIPCSVVRVDLNGYTQIFLEKKEEHIVSVLNEYFEVTNDIINRYRGEIYQIIGDEIIFIFKSPHYRSNQKSTLDTNTLEPELNALFSVKAIFEWSKKLDKKINEQFGHRFLLKSSISNGTLKFVKLNTGFAFAGVPLIESVRLLGSVSDKSENSLIVLEENYKNFQTFFPRNSHKWTQLKGFEEKVPVFEIKEFTAIDEYFTKSINIDDPELKRYKMKFLEYFKSQEDVLRSLILINKYFLANNLKPIFYLLQPLKNISISVSDPAISQRLFQILSDHFEIIQKQLTEYNFLSGLVHLIKNLVNRELWTEQWSQLLLNYLLSHQPRIVANSSEVYFYFHNKIEDVKNIFFNWQDNNRISANYVLAKLKNDISKNEIETVLKWLESENPFFQASGLYLIEIILNYYFEKDEVVFSTNEHLAKLKFHGLRLTRSSNEMVRHRAELLANTLSKLANKIPTQKTA